MNYTAQELANNAIYHARALRKALILFHKMEPLLRQDPMACVLWDSDDELSLAITAFEETLELKQMDR